MTFCAVSAKKVIRKAKNAISAYLQGANFAQENQAWVSFAVGMDIYDKTNRDGGIHY